MDGKIKQGVGKQHIEGLKELMNSVKVLPKGIYGITSNEFGQSHLESARIFLEAGVKIIQYREKKSPTVAEAAEIRKLCASYGALFIVNDNLDIAIATNADGVHLGQDDLDIKEAKKKFAGLIGISATNLGEAFRAQENGADYLGVGAMFVTDTKTDAKIVSFDEFRRIRDKISLPIYAIGGIKHGNLQMIKRLGADGVALISSVLAAPDPHIAAASMIDEWNKS